MRYKAVLFDLGGTLVKMVDAPEIFRRILEIYGMRVDVEQIKKAHEANKNELDVEAGQLELGMAFWTKWDATLLRKIGIEKDAECLAERISNIWWDHADLELYADVLPTLTHLRIKRIITGVVTNALRSDYEQILQKLQVKRYFDLLVGTDDCRAAKPDARIFQYALEKLDLQPSETLFIGDDVRRDYEGAEKIGMKPLLINRQTKTFKNVDTLNSLTGILCYF